ncbi:MAG: fibronectin type III domain-containing protein [bacterium]|nr:fibronectin type III domain-containing protein [bacterium]
MFQSDPVSSSNDWLRQHPDYRKSFWQRIWKPVVGLLVAGFLIFGVLPLLIYLFEPSSPPLNIFLTNVSDKQATVSWTTLKPTKGAISIGKILYKDDGDKNLARQGFYTTHHVTLNNLQPSRIYQYVIKQGRHKQPGGRVQTGQVLESLQNPNPVYGKALTTDKKPLVGAIVYFRISNGQSQSSLLSTLTNLEGGWTIDLANLRTKDLAKPFVVANSSLEEVVIEAGSKGNGKATTTPDKDTPWPDVTLNQK